MGITSVAPSSEKIDDWEVTDEEVNLPHTPLKGSTPRVNPDSGVGESSRGYGSASLLEVLNSQRIAQLEFPACPSQGAIEFLRTEQKPRQIMNPNSSSNFPQNFLAPLRHPHRLRSEMVPTPRTKRIIRRRKEAWRKEALPNNPPPAVKFQNLK